MKFLITPFSEIWANSNPMPKFRLKYFHRTISFSKDRDFDYMLDKFIFRWRFSLWLGKRCYHLMMFILFKFPTWERVKWALRSKMQSR